MKNNSSESTSYNRLYTIFVLVFFFIGLFEVLDWAIKLAYDNYKKYQAKQNEHYINFTLDNKEKNGHLLFIWNEQDGKLCYKAFNVSNNIAKNVYIQLNLDAEKNK